VRDVDRGLTRISVRAAGDSLKQQDKNERGCLLHLFFLPQDAAGYILFVAGMPLAPMLWVRGVISCNEAPKIF
jgi:hypothetical protein